MRRLFHSTRAVHGSSSSAVQGTTASSTTSAAASGTMNVVTATSPIPSTISVPQTVGVSPPSGLFPFAAISPAATAPSAVTKTPNQSPAVPIKEHQQLSSLGASTPQTTTISTAQLAAVKKLSPTKIRNLLLDAAKSSQTDMVSKEQLFIVASQRLMGMDNILHFDCIGIAQAYAYGLGPVYEGCSEEGINLRQVILPELLLKLSEDLCSQTSRLSCTHVLQTLETYEAVGMRPKALYTELFHSLIKMAPSLYSEEFCSIFSTLARLELKNDFLLKELVHKAARQAKEFRILQLCSAQGALATLLHSGDVKSVELPAAFSARFRFECEALPNNEIYDALMSLDKLEYSYKPFENRIWSEFRARLGSSSSSSSGKIDDYRNPRDSDRLNYYGESGPIPGPSRTVPITWNERKSGMNVGRSLHHKDNVHKLSSWEDVDQFAKPMEVFQFLYKCGEVNEKILKLWSMWAWKAAYRPNTLSYKRPSTRELALLHQVCEEWESKARAEGRKVDAPCDPTTGLPLRCQASKGFNIQLSRNTLDSSRSPLDLIKAAARVCVRSNEGLQKTHRDKAPLKYQKGRTYWIAEDQAGERKIARINSLEAVAKGRIEDVRENLSGKLNKKNVGKMGSKAAVVGESSSGRSKSGKTGAVFGSSASGSTIDSNSDSNTVESKSTDSTETFSFDDDDNHTAAESNNSTGGTRNLKPAETKNFNTETFWDSVTSVEPDGSSKKNSNNQPLMNSRLEALGMKSNAVKGRLGTFKNISPELLSKFLGHNVLTKNEVAKQKKLYKEQFGKESLKELLQDEDYVESGDSVSGYEYMGKFPSLATYKTKVEGSLLLAKDVNRRSNRKDNSMAYLRHGGEITAPGIVRFRDLYGEGLERAKSGINIGSSNPEQVTAGFGNTSTTDLTTEGVADPNTAGINGRKLLTWEGRFSKGKQKKKMIPMNVAGGMFDPWRYKHLMQKPWKNSGLSHYYLLSKGPRKNYIHIL